MKSFMKKVVTYFMLGLLLVPTLALVTKVQAGELTYEERKEQYLNYFKDARPSLLEAGSAINTWIITYKSEIIASITTSYIESMQTALTEGNIDTIFSATLDLFDEGTDVRNDLDSIVSTYEDFIVNTINEGDDFLQFLSDNRSEVTIEDAITILDKAINYTDEYMDVFVSAIDELNNNLPLGFYDLFLSEYEDAIYSKLNKINETLAYLEQAFMTRVATMLGSSTLTATQKINIHSGYLSSIETYRTKALEYYDTIIDAIDSNEVTLFADNLQDYYLDIVDYDLSYLTKLLLDNVTMNDLAGDLAQDEINEYIDEVYGVKTVSTIITHNSNTNILSTNSLSLTNNNISNYLETNFGEVRVSNLANNKIKTGTVVEVIENGVVKTSYVLVVKGDTLGRGVVDISNIVHIVDAVLGEETLSSIYSMASDLNDDNSTDISDIIALIDKILG
ncbi:MAG: hypothetical protein PHE54_05270 [Bacilli bacterium]|nr:hypothetical protein [Bacilli bacterium]